MEVSTLTVSVVSTTVGLLAIWAWKVLNWMWLRPKKLEKYLRQQGLSGSSYTFFFGDVKENKRMLKEALSKPINISDDIKPRLVPYHQQSVKNFGIHFLLLLLLRTAWAVCSLVVVVVALLLLLLRTLIHLSKHDYGLLFSACFFGISWFMLR